MLEVTELSRSFGGVRALQQVSLTARPGEVTGVIGPNGAGKSTLMSCLSGWLVPESGRATFAGHSLIGAAPADLAERGCIRTFQNLELLDESTVRENIRLGSRRLATSGLPSAVLALPAARRDRARSDRGARQAADQLGIGALLDRPAGSLSYGQRKRVELARAFAADPSLLLLDEPAAGLDDRERGELAGVIAAVAERGVTIVLVEHAIELVMALCAWVVVLDFGVTIAQGTAAEVRRDPKVIEAYLGRST